MDDWHGAAQMRVGEVLRKFNRKRRDDGSPGGWWLVSEPTIGLSLPVVVQPDVAGWRLAKKTTRKPQRRTRP
jgi:hypothetical protein